MAPSGGNSGGGNSGGGNSGGGNGGGNSALFAKCKASFNQKVTDETAAWNLAKTWIISNLASYHDQIETAAKEGETSIIIANVVRSGLAMYLAANPINIDPSVVKMWIRQNELSMLGEFLQVFTNEGFTAVIDRKKLILSGWDK